MNLPPNQPPWPPQPPGAPSGYGPSPYGPAPAGHSPYAPHPGFSPDPYGQAAAPRYEFGHAENEVIARAAGSARTLGILNYVSAALGLLGLNLVSAAISFVVGYQFHQGGTALKRVVDTPGNDIGHLMDALDKLSTAFMIRLILVLVAAVFIGLIAIVAGASVVAAISGGAQP